MERESEGNSTERDKELADGSCEMTDVREHTEGYPVELARNKETGRLVVRAWNEGHNNVTEVDVFDLVEWLTSQVHSCVRQEVEITPEMIEAGVNELVGAVGCDRWTKGDPQIVSDIFRAMHRVFRP